MYCDSGEERRVMYRSRHGLIFGVCRGVADYLDFSVFWTRTLVVVGFICSGLWPVLGIYFLAAILMKPEPMVPFQSDDDREFYNSYASSRGMAIQRLKHTYDSLDRRIQRMENVVTSRDYDWDRRLNS